MAVELRGKRVADVIRQHILSSVAVWRGRGITPRMETFLVEGDAASLIYAEQKARVAKSLGIEYAIRHFPVDVSQENLVTAIHKANENEAIHGIMLELPLPQHLATDVVTAAIAPRKDVDGLTRFNRLANITGDAGLYPATPVACIELLKHYGYTLAGKNVVLVGCGQTVGMPLMHLLLREHATVTVCHVGTKDLRPHIANADVVFVAVGKANLITPDMVHKDLLIVDAGINETPDKGIVGDVAPEVIDHVAAMSPTPGGVGTVTSVQLFANLLRAMDQQYAVLFA